MALGGLSHGISNIEINNNGNCRDDFYKHICKVQPKECDQTGIFPVFQMENFPQELRKMTDKNDNFFETVLPDVMTFAFESRENYARLVLAAGSLHFSIVPTVIIIAVIPAIKPNNKQKV